MTNKISTGKQGPRLTEVNKYQNQKLKKCWPGSEKLCKQDKGRSRGMVE